ncbi:MAG: hypothetical protein IGQ45_08355 [Cyanobacterium sp. T60_A2020_053]|nr:hypothetical protein [Cyanobacterium sp. T60_A2020_053]
MFSQEKKKIDLNQEYPCPCCRQGVIRPIVLTEALGCEKCQQIFVADGEKEYIEQLSTVSPYKKQWFWSGKTWVLRKQQSIPKNYFLFALWFTIGIMSLLLAVMPRGITFWAVAIIILMMISLLIWFLPYRY